MNQFNNQHCNRPYPPQDNSYPYEPVYNNHGPVQYPSPYYPDKPCYDENGPSSYPLYTPIEPLRGHVIRPPSRAQFLANNGLLHSGAINEMLGGKNFPQRLEGPVAFPFQDDVRSGIPPLDGEIISGHRGFLNALDPVNWTDDELWYASGQRFRQWPILRVNRSQILTIEWVLPQLNVPTRGYRFFITHNNWDISSRISRASLESVPFYEIMNQAVPWHDHQAELRPLERQTIRLPFNKFGRHVIVIIWLIANSPNAVYQGLDVDFGF